MKLVSVKEDILECPVCGMKVFNNPHVTNCPRCNSEMKEVKEHEVLGFVKDSTGEILEVIGTDPDKRNEE